METETETNMTTRFIAALSFYALAIAAFYIATLIAPAMTWPSNDVERVAASLLIAGFAMKLLGSVFLLSTVNRKA